MVSSVHSQEQILLQYQCPVGHSTHKCVRSSWSECMGSWATGHSSLEDSLSAILLCEAQGPSLQGQGERPLSARVAKEEGAQHWGAC